MNPFVRNIAIIVCFCYSVGAKSQSNFHKKLADSAFTLTLMKVYYVPDYVVIPYPNGDVAANTGVCSDVVIRAYRKMGVDLQKEVHLDMISHFLNYPKLWKLKKPDSNIDHRRVPNLMTFFTRHGASIKITKNSDDYLPGDIVCWKLSDGVTHIGLVSNLLASNGQNHLIIHNIGNGQVLEDCLFDFQIIGHYRYSR